MKKRTSKLLSLLLTLAMVLGMLPAMSITAAAYTAGDIEGTTGTGTLEDPVVCDTFAEFKAAMENTDFIFVKLTGASGAMPSRETLGAAISNTTYKVLTIEGTNKFWSPLSGNNDSLIWPKSELTINGTGTLKYEHGNTGGMGAVINMSSNVSLRIDGNVTLEGGANGTAHGRAIAAHAGTTVINGGSFIGYSALNNDYTDTDAVLIDNSAKVTINGGSFSASFYNATGSKKAYGLAILKTATGNISIKAGTFSQGIDIRATGKTIETCGYFNEAKEISVNGSVIAASESTEALIGQNVEVSNIASIRNLSATVTKPADGASPVFSATAGDDSYTVTVNEWYNGGTADTPNIPNTMSASDTFIAGNPYVVEVIFTPKEGYLIRSDRSVTINGLDAYFCGSQSSTGAVYYRVGFICSSKMYSGTGTYNDPAVCSTFAGFKAAMENSTVTNVVLKGGDVVSKIDTIPEPADGKVTDAVICSCKNGSKVLILEGKTEFVGCPAIDSLINLSVGERLTIMGDGELNYKHDNFHEAGAVVELSGQGSGLTVKGNVTLRGKTTGGVGFHGRAIYATNGTVDIHSGSFWGGGDLGSHADQVISSAVSIIGNANLNINGGSFTPTEGSPKCALYLDTTGTVNLREGTFYGKGIVIEKGGTIDATGYFTGTEIKIGSSTVAHTENVSALAGNTVQLSFAQFIHDATITVTDPMSGQAPNTTSFTVGDSTYTVDKITWYNGGTVDNPGTKMTSSDTFEAGQTYIVDVYVKPTGNYIIPVSGFTATINGVSTNEAKSRNVNTGAGNYRVALTCNKSLITSLSATGLPTLPAAGTKGEGVVNVPLTVTDPGYTATFTGWLRKTTLGDRQGYSVMTASNTFEAGETYFAEVMIVPVDGNLISTNATATVDGNTAVYTSGTVDGKRSYVVPFTVPNEAEETYTIEVENCREWNGKTKAAAGTKLTFISPSTEFESAGIFAKQWLVTVGDGEPTVVPDATQFNLAYEMPAANLKMKAVYTPAVTFMDGENTIVKKTVDTTTNKVTSWPTNPTKEGYQFIGWYTKANGGIQKSQDAEFEENTTLYAHWDKVISTVKITNVTLPRVDTALSAAGAMSETAGIEVDSANGVWYYSTDDGTTWMEVPSTLEANASDKYKFEVPFSIKDGYVLSSSAGCSISYREAGIQSNGVRKYIATLECEASPASVTYITFFGGYSIDGELKNKSPIGGVPAGTNVTLTPTDLDICRENNLTAILNLLEGKHFAGWKSWDGEGYYVVDLTENPDGSVSFTMPTAAEQAGPSEGICIAEIWEAHTAAQPATCTHKAVCSCGAEFGSLNPNNHSDTKGVYSITSATHQLFCQDCGAAMEDAAMHEYGADNKCAACGYERSTTLYTVTVIDGSATPASATAGTTVTLTADEPADGMKFKEWVVVSGSVTINSDNTFTMPESNVVIMASYVPKVVIPGTFAVTVNGSYASATGAGAYAPDEVVSIHAGTRSNYTFAGWTSSDVTIAGASNADASFIMPYNDVTVTANWTYNGSSGGSSGGGVSTYAITVDSAKNGDVTSSHKSAAKGTTITLTVEPDKGYTLETITATDASGNKLKLTEKDGKYTFTMPASKVTVKATFMEDNSMLNFFVDVPADAYYYDAVLWAAEKGITGGVDATHFAPNATCTRAQAVTFLWRAAGSPAPKSSEMPFTDVAPGSYYETAVLWAVENGITKGTSDTTFTPNAKCTRAQIVTFLWRSQKSPASDSVNPFTDVAADAYYNTAVLWAAENGITGGTSATTFSPNNDCTRAQIVTFLFRCLGK